MTTTLVLDLSSNNLGPWNFAVAKAAGIDGAIIKVAEGTSYTFDGFRAAFADAKAASLVRGAYYFARPGSTTPDAAASYFLQSLPPLFEGDIVALDMEVDGNGDMSEWALSWCRHVSTALGFVPLLYSYPDYITHHLPSPELAPYPLWLADLGAVARRSMPPWATVALRQYTWTGRYAGIPGEVDVSSFAGTADALRKLGKPAPKPHYPFPAHVTVRSDLKAAEKATGKPSHGSPTAIDEKHRPVVLEVGAQVLVTGDAVTSDTSWVPVKLPPPSKVHGWVLPANMLPD